MYKFGRKIINLRILNGLLQVRVGGGYMFIEEFIERYAKRELRKLKGKEFG